MKIISIIASPKGMNGNTARLIGPILEAASAAGAETETFPLSEYSILPCKGCETCSKTGKCVLNDDHEKIKEAMLQADGIIFGTPNYMFNVSGMMKNFIDRSYSLCHLQSLRDKYAVVALTSGSPYPGMGEEYLKMILGKMGLWVVDSLVGTQALLSIPEEKEALINNAYTIGTELVEAIQEKKTYTDQADAREEFFYAMQALVMMQKDEWPYEYQYWVDNWGIED